MLPVVLLLVHELVVDSLTRKVKGKKNGREGERELVEPWPLTTLAIENKSEEEEEI